MGTATSQQISNYYDSYRDTEITFTKEVKLRLFYFFFIT